MKGIAAISASILLVSFAQLAMRFGMSHISLNMLLALNWASTTITAAYLIVAGICAYILSTLCWISALNTIPLSKAYPLLSISYILVYGAAVSLPWFNEHSSRLQFSGVLFVILGITIMHWKRKQY